MSEVKIINLMKHNVRIVDEKGNLIREFPASTIKIDMSCTYEKNTDEVGSLDNVPISRTYTHKEENMLPLYREKTYYIVDEYTRDVHLRRDLLSPKCEVINKKGELIGYRYLDSHISPDFITGLVKK